MTAGGSNTTFRRSLAAAALLVGFVSQAAAQTPEPAPAEAVPHTEVWTLEQCLQRALIANHRGKISRFAVEMAEAQHRQALSGYWPQIRLTGGYERFDQPTNLLVPGQTISVAPSSIAVPATTSLVTIPANAFGPGFPPAAVQLPVTSPGGSIPVPAQSITTAKQSIQLLDQNLANGDVNATWLLFDGGMRHGLRDQASAGIAAANAEVHRTELEIAQTVRRLYWAAVLSRSLVRVGNDTVSRMEVTLHLTEAHAQDLSGKVTRSDYLYNKTVLESVRALVSEVEKNQSLAQAALANAVGLPWSISIEPADRSLAELQAPQDLSEMVSEAYQFNPDWNALEAGLKAADSQMRTARSEYFPKIAVKGDLHGFWNGGSDLGLSTSQNRFGWIVGAGLDVPLFNGFLTQNKVREALAKVNRLKETRLLLKDGLGLQVKNLSLQLESIGKSVAALTAASSSASENQELYMHAYENDMAEPDKVIQAQIIASVAEANLLKARYDRLVLGSELGLLIGREVTRVILQAPAEKSSVPKEQSQ